ncbi:hypothetical protein PIB30_081283 [Stylosanthes scabra]|uniref:Uncharacterized protein n=1 Tax=Stylosanthes scabra TaxID=79078 RepID=A0ABU6UTZ1_9FABA|nr:hypothetical protein [Stylosanthes scabra]
MLTNPVVNLTIGLDSSTTILSVFKIKEFQTGRESGRGAFVKWRCCQGIENMCACSWLFVDMWILLNSNPNLLLFDPEIERTLRRARQVRRRIEFENNLRSQTENLATENNSAYSSDSDFDFDIPSSSDTGTSIMGNLPRITLKQMGEASMSLENQPVRFSELNENFELKSGLINLLPRFH